MQQHLSSVPTITAGQLRERLASPNPPLLVDVREPSEWQFCRLAEAVHIPLGELEARRGELDPDREIVIYCHHGVRSERAARILLTHQFKRVASLQRGIDAWSLQIDPSIPRY